jgi:hypothetical protein
MKNNEANTKIELTAEQQYPGLLLPEDLKILSPQEAASLSEPFHGQGKAGAGKHSSVTDAPKPR